MWSSFNIGIARYYSIVIQLCFGLWGSDFNAENLLIGSFPPIFMDQ